MSDRAAELHAALLAADTAPAILEAVVRAAWYNAHDGAECPDSSVVTAEVLIAWLSECPLAARAEAGELLDDLARRPTRDNPAGWPDATGGWQWEIYRPGSGGLVMRDSANDATLNGPALVASDPVVGPSMFATLPAVHARWCALPDPRPRHPLAPLVAAWQAAQPIERDRRPRGILPDSWRRARYHDHLPLLQRPYPEAPGKMAGDQHLLPLVELETPSVVVPVLPLALYDSGAGPLATRGRGAPYAQRLFVEILLDVGRLDRVPGQTARVEVPLRDLVAWLWPKRWQRTPLRRPPR